MKYRRNNPFGNTPAEYRETMEILANDGTVRQVAARFGVTRRTVQTALRRWGVRLRYGYAPDVYYRAEVLAAVGDGAGLKAVAARVGRSRASVKRVLADLKARGLVRTEGYNRFTTWRTTERWDHADRKA